LTLLKSIVVCLVLANVCYFLWERGIAKSPNSAAAAAPATLKLASESPDAARSAGAESGAGAINGGAGADAAPDNSSAPGGSGLLTNV
jgi:hypothetical protein